MKYRDPTLDIPVCLDRAMSVGVMSSGKRVFRTDSLEVSNRLMVARTTLKRTKKLELRARVHHMVPHKRLVKVIA